MLNTFRTLVFAWLDTYNCVLLFGLFYGFLSTLPLSPAQIYFARSFILEHDARRRSEFKRKYLGQEKGFSLRKSQVIFSGSLFAQAIVFFSIYCTPIYLAFFNPHATLFIAAPIVCAILHKYIQELSPNRIKLLLIGITLHLINPILFFSDSTFTRLINLLLFRYTENLVFLISAFIGWLSGQILFIKLAKFFCLRIERDSTLLGSRYATSKRYIKETLKIFFFGYFFLFCFSGNTPNVFFTKRFKEELFGKNVLVEPFSTIQKSINKLRRKEQGNNTTVRLLSKSSDKQTSKKKSGFAPLPSEAELDDKASEIEQEQASDGGGKDKKPYHIEYVLAPWIGKTWLNMFYDYRRWNWPIRYIEVDPENFVQGHFVGPLKSEVADYFFDTCISDGREKLSFTSSPSAFWFAEMIRQNMGHSETLSGLETDSSNEDNFDKWVVAKTSRRDYLGSELEDRVKALSNGSPILGVIEKRVKFSMESGTCLPEIEDPFLSGPFRGIMEHSRSAWIPLSKKISDEDILAQKLLKQVQELSKQRQEQSCTPEEKEKAKLTITEIVSILKLLNKNKRRKEIRTKLIRAKKLNFLLKTVMKKLKKLIRFSNKLCLFFDERKLSFSEKHGKNERISNTPEEEQIYDQRKGEDLIGIMDELMGEFSFFIKKKGKKDSNITDIDVIGNLEEGSLSGEDAFEKFIDKFFLFVENKLLFLDKSEKDEQISDQKKENDNFEKGVSAPIFFFSENKKVKLIFNFWLPLFDLFRRRKVGLKELENLVFSKRKAGKALDPNISSFFNKIFLNELKLSEIKRDAPFWASKLHTGLFDDFGETNDLDLASPDARSALLLDPVFDDPNIVSWIWEADDDRNIIKGSIRAQRRNLNTLMVYDLHVRSSFFVRFSEMGVKSERIRKKRERRDKIKVKFYSKANWLQHPRGPLRKMYNPFLTSTERTRLEELTWMDEEFIQIIRSVCLIILLYVRKFILVPLFIITKNIVRTLLFQFPELKEDWNDWTREMYVICDYDGVEYSETEYPEDFWEVGMQVKVLSPFRFKPWHEEHSEGDAGYLTMNPMVLTEKPFSGTTSDSEHKKNEDLSKVWEEFFGPIKRFWGPRIKQMIQRINSLMRPVIALIKELIRRIKESIGRVIGRIKELIRFIKFDEWIRHIKELIGRVIERTMKWIRRIQESMERVLERSKKLLGRVLKGIKWIKKSELKPDQKVINDDEMNDRVPSQLRIPSQLQIKAKPRVKHEFGMKTRLNLKERTEEPKVKQRTEEPKVKQRKDETKMKQRKDETKMKQRKDETKMKQRNEDMKQITEKYLLNLDIHAKLKKEIDQYSYDIGSGLKDKLVQKRIREITDRKKSVRFGIDRNSRYFKKLFLRKKLIVINLKLSVMNLIDSIFHFFNLLKRKIAAIPNNDSNTILNPEKKQDFKIGPDKISQAYVFHKMWQIRTMNKSYAKDLLKSRTSSPLIKKNIKELLEIQGILESKQPQDLRMNHWKQWLNFCYGYRVVKPKGSRLSQIWSRIAPQKRRNKLSNQCTNKHKREFESFIGMLQKWNKRYRYDLLAYNFLDSEKEHIHRHLIQEMVVRDIPDHINTNKKTRKSLVSNFFTLDKSDLKLHKEKWNKTELRKSDGKSDIKLDKSDGKSDIKLDKSNGKSDILLDKSDGKSDNELDKSDKRNDNKLNKSDERNDNEPDKKGKSTGIRREKLYHIDIFANRNETDRFHENETNPIDQMEPDQFNQIKTAQFNQFKTDQSLDSFISNFESNESRMDIESNESKMDENLLIEFLDGYKFLKSYWFFPIFAENLELSGVIQTIRSDITSLIEYCQMRLPVDQYLSELNSYYSELCKERAKKVKDHNKINKIRDNINKLNASLDNLSPHMDNFINKVYAKSDLKLPWLKPEVSFALVVKKKKISKKLLEEDKKLLEEDKKLLEGAKKLLEGDKLLEEDKKLLEGDKLLEEDKKLLEGDKKLLEEDKKLLEKDKKLLEEDKKLLEKGKKLLEKHKKLLEKEMKPPILRKTEISPEEPEAIRETQIQLIREEISKLIREEAQIVEQPTTAEETEIQTECEADYEVPLRDYLRKDHTVFIPLNKVMEKDKLTAEIIAYKQKLAEAIDAFHFICLKRAGMSELYFWKIGLWLNFNRILNEVAELDRFPTIQLNKLKTLNFVFSDLKKAIEKQPKRQGHEEKRKDSDRNVYNELKVQLNPGWEKEKGDNKNIWIQANRVGAKIKTERISRNGGLPLLKQEVWFLSQYEYIANTMEFLLFDESKKDEAKNEKSDKSKADKAKPAQEEQVSANKEEQVSANKEEQVSANKDEQVSANKEEQVSANKDEQISANKDEQISANKDEQISAKNRKVHKEVPLSTRALRHLTKICNLNDATDVVVFLHKFHSKKYPELEHLMNEKKILKHVANCLCFNDCPNHWALLGCNNDRSLVDQMLFNMWLDPLVYLSVVLKDIKVFKSNNRIREGLYVDLSDRSARSILNEKISSSLIFEDILLPRRRREFRILNRLNLENNLAGGSTGYSNGKQYVQSDEELMEKDQCVGIDTTQKMKRFLWPRYRVEDLICMNRYWWNSNRSRTVLKVRMYPKMDNWNSWENLLCLITKYMRKLLFLMHSIIKKLLFYANSCKAEECYTLNHFTALQQNKKKER
uniref:Protein TIC 214 n=1 Tax=Podocarpus latifolius TaxID=120620 RepID=A0A4D6EWW9_9CONI|nr:Ycf1 [Podocarpus latifolius]QCA41131.1 Ycf1 [Podocarpus latifolius]